MINVNKITATLAKMPDAQLQQYAQMHKNDPYIMALAMSESSRRKEMRSAGQGAQGMQEQPKVIDQMVAQMAPQRLPEEQGIGRLPVGNMDFAGGGIVAFADGGDVERYQYGGTTLRNSVLGDIPGFDAGPVDPALRSRPKKPAVVTDASFNPYADFATVYDPVTGAPITGQATTEGGDVTVREALGLGNPENRRAIERMDAAAKQREADKAKPAQKAAPAVEKPAPAVEKPAPTLERTGTQRGATGPGKAASGPAAEAVNYGSLDPNKLFGASMKELGKDTRPEKTELENINKLREDAAKEEKTGIEALQAKFADAYKGRRERLDKSESELGERKDQYFGLALLQAGAAMMSTPGSLGQSIGKGIESGSKQYVAGMDKLNAAKDKLADARDKLDDLELNRNEMSAREILKAENNIRNTAISGKENMVKYLMDRDKVDRETALKMMDGQIRLGISQIEQTNENARNAARVAATAAAGARNPQLEMLKAVSADPKLAATYQAMHGTKGDIVSQYTDYLGKNPTGSVDDFLRDRGILTALTAIKTNPPKTDIAPRAP